MSKCKKSSLLQYFVAFYLARGNSWREAKYFIIFFCAYRSELVIEHTGAGDNGTYYCQAENKAARSISNFTLHVTDREVASDGPTILQVRTLPSYSQFERLRVE